MTTLYHTINNLTHNQNKNTSNTFGVRLISSKNRNLSVSKLQQKSIDIQNAKATNSHLKITQSNHHGTSNKQIKKYCLNKLKNSHQTQKFIAFRKNRSLKLIKKEESYKYFNKTKLEPLVQPEVSHGKKQGKYLQECVDKIKGVSIKRRVELIKKNNMKLKIVPKENHMKIEQKKNQTSFQHKYISGISQFQKLISTNKIQSENILGQGLKKSSSYKMKALVKNPFERYIRNQELRHTKNKQILLLQTCSFEEMHQSNIRQNLDKSRTIISNLGELQEMLALI